MQDAVAAGQVTLRIDRQPSRFRLSGQAWLAIALLAAGWAAVSVDVPVAYALFKQRLLKVIDRPLQIAEPFGDAAGVVAIAVAIAVLDPERRRRAVRVLCAGLGGGLAADIPKLLVVRVRPNRIDFETVRNGWDTFQHWLPQLGGSSRLQSFPSAHTASACALAVALVTLYPRGKWLFPCFAGLVAFQRVESGAHYLSDAFCGAALGLIVGSYFHGQSRLAACFDRYESTSATSAATGANEERPLQHCA